MTRNSAMYETPYESVVPEQCQITWIIRDFSSFRHASRNAPIPPLKSPDISSKGLRALLHPYWKKGDIVAEVVLPECCSIATTYCFKFSVISPLDAKLIISREVSSTVKRGKTPPRTVVRLWHKSISRRTSYQKLLTNNQLTLVIQAEVYDHSATPFVGIPATEIGSEDGDACLLQDIREFCESTPAQTIQVVCGPTIYTGCRFLLQARSQKMRILLADREKNWQRLVIGDLEPAIVGQIMNFVHTNSCEYLAEESTDDGDLLRLLLACNNYHIPSLAEKICQKLMCRLQMHNVLRYWEVAKSCDLCAALTQACCRYLDGLPGSRVADMMKKHVSDVSVP
ncbi:BTB/POZ domain protein [Gregarina niphandrodes]|uniref:BTB/POZ domain protein n=1 Tax=Gregarina niphandrodes TaxID=110365 RepID=A0A023B364_GRENI|nr:BTB/POZ domain protein [Gregarina niphandrodes]EZG55335.1 BTB/POZ domain protein [Gregarina niphandrodes]|eukprot:XP_011131630.1 BTB/POZ domain protein [Gregarina niphandrodes]